MSEPLFLPPGAPKPSFHPFADWFPMLEPEELKSLAISIKEKGQMQPVVLHRGFILDGRNRWNACELAGIGVRCIQFAGDDRAAVDFVIAENLERRHLSTQQRSMIGAKYATYLIKMNQYTAARAAQPALALTPAPIGAGAEAGKLIDIDPEIVAQVEERGGHTVTMTNDQGMSIGTCRCGAAFRVPRDGTSPPQNIARANEMNRLIEAHWRESLGLPAAEAAAPTEMAPTAPDGQQALVSQTRAAEVMNVSRRSVQRAAVVVNKGSDDLRAAVDAGAVSLLAASEIAVQPVDKQAQLLAALTGEDGKLTADAKKVVAKAAKELRTEKQAEKKAKRNEKEARVGARNRGLPDVLAGVIVADPQWGRTVYSTETGMDRHAANHYPVAEGSEATQDDAIKALPVVGLAAADAVLGLWCTEPWRGEAVARAWGFVPKAYFVWVKDIVVVEPPAPGQGIGMLRSGQTLEVVGAAGLGLVNRDRCEIMLYCTRGKPPGPAFGEQGERVWFARRGEHATTRDDAHSDKPDCALEWFERHWPTAVKVELNARRAREGWIAWGNEAPELELEALPPRSETDGDRLGRLQNEVADLLDAAPPQRTTHAAVNFGTIGVSRNRNCGSCEYFHAPCACNRVVGLIENRTATICDLFAPFDAPVRVQTDTERARAEFEQRVEGVAS